MSEDEQIKAAKTRVVPTGGETKGLTPIPVVLVPTGTGRENAGLTPIPLVPTNRQPVTNKKKG
jgi:hypothetical protein